MSCVHVPPLSPPLKGFRGEEQRTVTRGVSSTLPRVISGPRGRAWDFGVPASCLDLQRHSSAPLSLCAELLRDAVSTELLAAPLLCEGGRA